MESTLDGEGEGSRDGEAEMDPLVFGVAATSVYLQRMSHLREREVDVRSVNSATYTFLWIAASYTACNALSLFVSVLERLPGPLLLLLPSFPCPHSPLPLQASPSCWCTTKSGG